MFKTLLIANRGEIAVRIIRACRELGIRTVAVYSDADAKAMHTRLADAAAHIGPPPPRDSYLNVGAIVEAARKTGAQAVHPGYGFLSERAEFAEAVAAAGLVFVGPPADAIRKMGSKTGARAIMQSAGVPIVPGSPSPSGRGDGGEGEIRGLADTADRIGYPVLVKAAAGGGGKGMRVVQSPGQLSEAVAAAQREAMHAFGDGGVFLEKYLPGPRHVEFQVLADSQGTLVHLFERECSIQRRHQKIVEETPSPFVTPELRQAMGAAAVAAAKAVGYVNAGTVEFIVDQAGGFYFLEMNTRLQVEHPITEMVTGIDLVKAQIRIAAGEALWFGQGDVAQRGHAIECRVYAEDPSNDFLPSIGVVTRAAEPVRPGVRVDSGVAAGDEVTVHYDPMMAKVIAYGETRDDAIRKMEAALGEYVLDGVTTNIPFLKAVIAHPAFAQGKTTTHFIEQHMSGWRDTRGSSQEAEVQNTPAASRQEPAANLTPWERADAFRLGMGRTEPAASSNHRAGRPAGRRAAASRAGSSHELLEAAMPGQVRAVLVKQGESVEKGQTLALLEAMKMEIRVAAPHAGSVVKVLIVEGQVVERGQQLFDLTRPSKIDA